MIASDDTGESAFIVAAAQSNPQRNDVIVRSSKLLIEADWFRHRERHLIDRPDQFVARSESLGISYMVLDRTKMNGLWELRLIGNAVRQYPDRLQRIAEFPQDSDRLRTLEVYRFTQAAKPPRELLKYRLPYTLGREISEQPPEVRP